VKLVLKKNVIINSSSREFFKRKITNILREYEEFLVDSSLAAGKKRKKKPRTKNRLRGRSIKRKKRGRGSKKMRR